MRRARDLPCGDSRVYVEFEVRRVDCRVCGTVKRERLGFLADNPFYTKRFAHYVGQRCRSSSIRDVAKELRLDWHTVKELDKEYMRAQLARAPKPAPAVIGIDELSVRKVLVCSNRARPRALTPPWRRIPSPPCRIARSRSGSAHRIPPAFHRADPRPSRPGAC
ncbi:MAG: hypothetical protein FJY54_01955 [Betaproteobacteria bacterium]|nr:hypothetical protein [Betaproteobacteria bacterium]